MNLNDLVGVEEAATGGLNLRPFTASVGPFFDYYELITACDSTSNPWLKQIWTEYFLKEVPVVWCGVVWCGVVWCGVV